MITIKKIMFSKSSFVVGLCFWCLLNAILYVSANPALQYVPMLFAIWAIVILTNECFVKKDQFLKFDGVGYGFLIVLAVVLSFVCNQFISPVKNIYTVIAVAINFILLYTASTDINIKKGILLMARIATVTIFILTIISLLLLYFRVSIPLGDPADQLFIGMDSIHNRYTGTAGNPNGLSRMCLGGIIAALVLIAFDDVYVKKILYKTFLWSSIMINVISILMTESRGTTLSMYAGTFFIFVLAAFFKVRKMKWFKQIGIIVATSVATIILLFIIDESGKILVQSYPYYQPNLIQQGIDGGDAANIGIPPVEIKSRYEKEEGLLDGNISNGRLTLIRNGINATIHENLMFGLTYGGVNERIQEYIVQEDIEVADYLFRISGTMHNTIIQTFTNYGLFGLVWILLFLFYMIKVFLRILCINNYTKAQAKVMLLFSFILFSLATLNMVEAVFYFDFDNHLINLILMITFGMLIHFAKENFGDKVVSDRLSQVIQTKLLQFVCFVEKVHAPNKV